MSPRRSFNIAPPEKSLFEAVFSTLNIRFGAHFHCFTPKTLAQNGSEGEQTLISTRWYDVEQVEAATQLHAGASSAQEPLPAALRSLFSMHLDSFSYRFEL